MRISRHYPSRRVKAAVFHGWGERWGFGQCQEGEEKLLLTILPRPRSSRWCFGERPCSHALGACGRRSLSHRREHVLCQPSSADAGDHCDFLPDVRICPRANVGDVVSRAVTPEGLVRAAIARSGPYRQRYVTGRRKGEIWPAKSLGFYRKCSGRQKSNIGRDSIRSTFDRKASEQGPWPARARKQGEQTNHEHIPEDRHQLRRRSHNCPACDWVWTGEECL